MKTFVKRTVILGAIASLMMAIVACSQEGTGEKAGKEVDKAVDTFKEKVHEATK